MSGVCKYVNDSATLYIYYFLYFLSIVPKYAVIADDVSCPEQLTFSAIPSRTSLHSTRTVGENKR